MIKYFKKLYTVFLIVGIAAILAAMYSKAPMSWNTEGTINFWSGGQSANWVLIYARFSYIISLIRNIVVVICIFEFIAFILLSAKVRILSNDLKPQKFLDEFSPVLKRAMKINCRRVLNCAGALAMITHYSQGLFEAGRTDEAVKLLEDEIKKSRRKSSFVLMEKCGAYCALCMFHYQLGEPEELARCSAEVKNLSAQVKGKLCQRNIRLYKERAAAFDNLKNGRYDDAVEFYSHALKESKFNLERVRAHCRLAEAYAAVNNPERSNAHLQMALEMGSELFTVKATQHRLQNADTPTPS